jgi:CRP-like cAMP-binding protein
VGPLWVMRAAEAGKSFGELALITDDAVRSASVIADASTDLMIIKKQLFDDTLKVRNL